MKAIISICLLLMVFKVNAQSWDQYNNPFKLDKKFITKFTNLPLQGKIADGRMAWPANHWANYTGGIAYRWSSGDPQPFTYKTLSLPELLQLQAHEVNALSPTEKYDIFRSDYEYSLTKKVLAGLSPRESEWHGLCHGVIPATIHHAEPDTVTLKNKDGVSLVFYSSDVAGLMAYYYAKVAKSKVTLVGRRCYKRNLEEIMSEPSCLDLNPGSFHIILTNMLGKRGQSFIADTERRHEVWNHAVVSYEALLLGQEEVDANSAAPAVRRLRMETRVTYAAAIAQKFYPVIGTENAEYLNYTYEYLLDLDASDRIVGGSWIGEQRPDFVWVQDKAKFDGDWSTLNRIYRPTSP